MTRRPNRSGKAGLRATTRLFSKSVIAASALVFWFNAAQAGTIDAFAESVDDPDVTAPAGAGFFGEADRGGADFQAAAPMPYCERLSGMWTCLRASSLRAPGIARTVPVQPAPLPGALVFGATAVILLAGTKRLRRRR